MKIKYNLKLNPQQNKDLEDTSNYILYSCSCFNSLLRDESVDVFFWHDAPEAREGIIYLNEMILSNPINKEELTYELTHELIHVFCGPYLKRSDWFNELLACSFCHFVMIDKFGFTLRDRISLEELKSRLQNHIELFQANPRSVYLSAENIRITTGLLNFEKIAIFKLIFDCIEIYSRFDQNEVITFATIKAEMQKNGNYASSLLIMNELSIFD